MRRGVFLDRDGTLIEEVGYLDRIDRVRFFPYSVDAVRLLNRAGVVVDRRDEPGGHRARLLRRGVCRGRRIDRSRRRSAPAARASTASTSARIIRRPELGAYRQACDCRKPQPGLAAARGRRSSDSTCGDRSSSAIARTTSPPARPSARKGVLVRTGYGDRVERSGHGAAAVTDNLMGAVSWILRQL